MTALIVIVAIVVLLLAFVVVLYNRLVRLRNESDQGFSGIDVQLKRRADLIPNLVTTVQAYATHEKAVFDDVTKARAQTLQAQTLPEKAIADGVMQSALTGLLGVAEAYPDLKAVQSFRALQDELVDTEDKIAAARRYYNTVVRRYNTATQTLPSNVVAGIGGFKTREFYRLEDDGQRSPVAVSLGA
jgi:LemA protein